MNKHLSLMAGAALALAFAATPALAQNDTRMTASSGPYIGAYGGYGWTDADTAVGSADIEGADYGLFAGWELGGMFDRMNLGMHGALEAYYGWSSADDNSGALSVEKNHEWGVTFRPGFDVINDSMPLNIKPYGIVGYRRAEFEATAPGISAEEDFDGFELGLGTELVAYGDMGVRLDYSHVFYEENGGIDPDEDNLRLGLAYHF